MLPKLGASSEFIGLRTSMQTCSFVWRRAMAAALFFAVCGGAAPSGTVAQLPIRQIVLYKHGIGYFERQGTVGQEQEARLDFKNSEMNDVLKSLTVSDGNGGRISGVRYDSHSSLQDQLKDFPFTIGQSEYLSAFLDSLKGSRLQIKAGDRSVEGVILGARAISSGAD